MGVGGTTASGNGAGTTGANAANVVDSPTPGDTGGCSTVARAPVPSGAWLALGVGVAAAFKRRSNRAARPARARV